MLYFLNILPTNAVEPKKKTVPDFRQGENILCDRKVSPPHLNYDISLAITFLKIDTWNITYGSWITTYPFLLARGSMFTNLLPGQVELKRNRYLTRDMDIVGSIPGCGDFSFRWSLASHFVHVRKVVSGFGKKRCASTGMRKPGNT